MRSLITTIVLFLFLIPASISQNRPLERLKVFVDCSNTWCDMNFIRSEINLVDFMLDRTAADLHILITQQPVGSGGSQYQLIFFGQNQLKEFHDTLRFTTGPNATSFESRADLIKYLKIGLAPHVGKTNAAKNLHIDMKSTESEGDAAGKDSSKKDPWNYWVFRLGMNGHLDADEVYKSSRISINTSASRVTEQIKIGFDFNLGKNNSTFTLIDDNGDEEKIRIRNNDFSASHSLIKSINQHWSWGYEAAVSRSTFSNNKNRILFRSGIEYAIFPYKEVNTRFFTISYIADIRRNQYFDTTLYDKKNETLGGHGLEGKLSFNQKWGTIGLGAEYHNYFHDWNFFNLGINSDVSIRITGGLSFNIYTSAELTRDQIFLPKEGATPQEVLTRRRQLASGYRFYTYFGINYRFGSKLNNFVNPRFD